MPPKPKCTKNEVIQAAYEMAREKGIAGGGKKACNEAI